ncbi:MAG: RluA family pseudouridine synthase [Methyloligellaceae bacterium]
MTLEQTFVADDQDEGERLDRFLANRLAQFSRSRLKDLVKNGSVTCQGSVIATPNHRIKPGEAFTVRIPDPVEAIPKGEDIPLDILYEDADLIIINKPAGLVVHPAAGNWTGTLVNALIAHCGASLSGIGGVKRPGIVHRLDKETSGVMVVAKTDVAHQGLARQFARHGRDGKLDRRYAALVWGIPKRQRDTISAPLGRHRTQRTRYDVVQEGGKAAITHYTTGRTIFSADGTEIAAEIECRLETGRTHQIRVHMAHLGHPLLGDNLYGSGYFSSEKKLLPEAQEAIRKLNRQALHAKSLKFVHPVRAEEMTFESDFPPEFRTILGPET